ncbi:hypothetical protein AAFF_G00135610 [Aldrovandia affinis]|uniref:Uncharacterized protein n=2 Tax=Aldrovandia affinis TaxID=143900 RepID=A0AAD7VXB4_9TELE|nr:hypothetical protein AAFF_G00135610 [Aldrovandia affinis]
MVDVSPKDATGLHEKLDRKKSVQQHNSDAQQRFADQMEAVFTEMQTAVEQQGAKQQAMLSSYKCSVAELQKVNDRSVSGMMSTVTASFQSIKDVVHSSMAKCHAGMMEQETLCGETKRTLQTLLEEHEQELQKLLAMLVPGLTALGEMNEELKQTLQRHYAVAEQMERMRSESASFFRDHLRALVQLRETATAALTSLQTEQESLTQLICEASHTQATRISQVISCMEGQMRLLDVETKSGFSGLLGLKL